MPAPTITDLLSERTVLQALDDAWVKVTMTPSAAVLSGDQALSIAQTDAMKAYRDLSAYRIDLVLEKDGWHVDYNLKDRKLKGGAPHYLIDAHSGIIVSKRYEQ